MADVDPDVASYFSWRIKEWTAALIRDGDKKFIEGVIAQCKRASTSGWWTNKYHLEIPLHSKRNFISSLRLRISRGEAVEVLEIDKGWLRLRTEKGIEGWSIAGNVLPKTPVQLSSRPGGSGGARYPTEIEIGGRG